MKNLKIIKKKKERRRIHLPDESKEIISRDVSTQNPGPFNLIIPIVRKKIIIIIIKADLFLS